MAKILNGRHTADLTNRDEIVVFLIGMRINRLWQVRRWPRPGSEPGQPTRPRSSTAEGCNPNSARVA